MVQLRVIQLIVHAHHNVERALLYRRGDHYLSDTTMEIRFQCLRSNELARTFEHDFNPGFAPWHFARSIEAAVADALAVYFQPARFRGYRNAPTAMHAIEFEQMSGGLGITLQLIDVDNFNLGMIERGAQRQPAHPSKPVNANSYRHGRSCLHHAARFNLPISVTHRSNAKRSSVSIGSAVKILIRCSSSV